MTVAAPRTTNEDRAAALAAPVTPIVATLRAIAALVRRDVLLLVRRPSRILATLLTPALMWAFFAGGFSRAVSQSGRGAGEAYTLSLSSGAALLVVTFASIFGALGLIRDRESGYLQAVLVGPTPRWAVIGARVASGSALAFAQGVTMLIAAWMFADGIELDEFLASTAMLALTAIGLSGGCTALAWHFRSIEGFHGIMAGVLLPAWLLSGAVFPHGSTTGGMDALMLANPLAYAHSAIAGSLGAFDAGPIALFVTAVFGAGGLIAAIVAARGDAKR